MAAVLAAQVCAAGCGERSAEPVRPKAPPLEVEEARALVAEAASCPLELLQQVVEMGAGASVAAIEAKGGGVPYTAVVLGMPMAGSSIAAEDFRVEQTATPVELIGAVYPQDIVAGANQPRHERPSLVHPEYVSKLELQQDEERAAGTLHFRVPRLYEGRVGFEAKRVDGAWRITALTAPASGLRWTRDGGRWSVRMPEAKVPADLEGLDLPEVTQVGDAPPAETSLVIRLTRFGELTADGTLRKLTFPQLQTHLRGVLARRGPQGREPDGASKADVIIEVDRAVPWQLCQYLLQTCCHPDLKVYRSHFRARLGEDGDVGTIAVFLPKDVSPPPAPAEGKKHKVKLFQSTSGPSDLRALWAEMLALPETERNGAQFEIVAPPPKGGAVPSGYVLAVVDLALRAGAASIVFEGAAPPLGDEWSDPGWLARRIRDLQGRPGTPYVKLGTKPIEPNAATAPALPPPQKAEGLVGSTETAFSWEPIVKEVPERPGGVFHRRGTPRAGLPSPEEQRRESAIDRGLRWLAAHQQSDGSWGAASYAAWCDGKEDEARAAPDPVKGEALYDVGVTGLAMCAFLGAGYTNRGLHPYAKTLSRAARFLKNVQDPEGCFGPRLTQQYVYNHAAAALAMVEIYGMTGSPIFKGSAQRALDFTAYARNPYWGWRYGIKPGENDTSVTAWMTSVVHAAALINADAVDRGKPPPLTIDEACLKEPLSWIAKVTDLATGRGGYVTRGSGSARPAEALERFPLEKSESMTAAAILVRLQCGEDPAGSDAIAKGAARIRDLPPDWNPGDGSIDMYYWWYATRVLWHLGGDDWPAWRRVLERELTVHQRTDTDPCMYQGSWDPLGPWGADGGRVYATALMVLALETEQREPRVYPMR